MEHTVIDRPLAFKGPSKIPRLDSTYQFSGIRKESDNYGTNDRENSRLLQMQAQYQQKMLKDKEEKLVHIYNSNQQRSLNAVQKGTARDFFQERRKMAEQKVNISHMPSMHQHYRQTRGLPGYSESSKTYSVPPPPPSYQYNQSPDLENRPTYKKSYVGMMNKQQVYKKTSAGRDRSNPLAPIERNNTQDSGYSAPIPRKPVLHGRPSSKDSQKKIIYQDNLSSKSAPIPAIHSQHAQEESPLPSSSKFKKASSSKQTTKKSDFLKWQEEQEQARAQRLQQYQQKKSQKKPEEDRLDHDEDEGIEEDTHQNSIAQKQRELMEEIAKRQADLENMKKDRQQEQEAKAKAEKERRRKQEEERQRREKREAEKRKREEAEERRREEQEARRRKEETENERRIEEAMRREEDEQKRKANRSRQPSQQESHNNYMDNDSYREPVPPSAPKPSTMSRRRPPPNHSVASSIDETALPQTSARDTGDLAFFLNAAKSNDAKPEGRTKLVKCSNCGRTFADDRIQKHKNACGNITKKRKVMDPAKMRTEGTEMANYQGRSRKSPKPSKKNNWRKKHEEFIANIKYAKQMAQMEKDGVSVSNLPPPPRSENPDYVECPYCSRKFNESAAERHIPRCKDLKTKPAPMKIRR